MLLKAPGFTAVAIACLALGIGANSTIFSLADATLFRPLPVRAPASVMAVAGEIRGQQAGISYRTYLDVREQSKAFESLAAYQFTRIAFSAGPADAARMKLGLAVSGNFFESLGVTPALGRAFRPDEGQVAGRDAVVVISHGFHEEQFHSDPSVVGRIIRLNGIEFTIIGVAPAQFTGMDQYSRPSVLVPIVMMPRLAGSPNLDLLEKRDAMGLNVRGRLRAGVSQAGAQAELKSLAANLEKAYPETNRNYTIRVLTELQNRILISPPDAYLTALLGGLAGLVLLIACCNVANLLLSRARARSREIASRLALGASRGRLVRQLLTESLMLAGAGALAGLLVAQMGVDYIAGIRIPADPPIALYVAMDKRLLLFTMAVSVACAVLFGIVPALESTRSDLVRALKAGDSETGRKRRLFGRNALAAAQVALSMVVLVAGAIFVLGGRASMSAGPGFRVDHLMTMSFDPALVRYSREQTRQFYDTLLQRARALPGVKQAALTSAIPTGMTQGTRDIAPEGHQFPQGQDRVTVLASSVTDAYFETMGIPIVRGREIRATDTAASPRVAVINQTLAERYWPGKDPVGKRLRLDGPKGSWVEIVGVARNGKYVFILERATPFLYLPAAQSDPARMTLLAESRGEPAGLSAPLKELVGSIDSGLPVYEVRTMEEFHEMRSVEVPRAIATMVSSMGFLALSLALIGLYGVVSYTVSRRTREFGIRMAIGADPGAVLMGVLRGGIMIAAAGIGAGALGSLAILAVIRAAFGPSSADVAALVLVPLMLVAVTALATLVPAWRASRIAPTEALRYE